MAINQNTSIGSKKYNENFDRIFGSKEERAKKHAAEKKQQEENATKMREASKSAYINGTFEPFKSPIDGSIISCPSQLRSHNSRHGVTDLRDYSDEWFKRRGREMYDEKTGNTEQAKRERRQLVEHKLRESGVIR